MSAVFQAVSQEDEDDEMHDAICLFWAAEEIGRLNFRNQGIRQRFEDFFHPLNESN